MFIQDQHGLSRFADPPPSPHPRRVLGVYFVLVLGLILGRPAKNLILSSITQWKRSLV